MTDAERENALAAQGEIGKRPINVYGERQTPVVAATSISGELDRWADPAVEEAERWDGMS
jgi:hypothetical protein